MVFAVVLFALSLSPDAVIGARTPALSPDGKTVAFSYLGDIWTAPTSGGRATRVTVHVRHEIRPQFSPDGKQLAFSSDREGGYDVYVMDAAGGKPKRLTYHSASDMVTDWTADGKKVLFLSNREARRTAVYAVDVMTGATTRLTDEDYQYCYAASASPDGRRLAITRGAAAWYRKRYKGGGQFDIYTYAPESREYERLTDWEGQDHWPMWTPDGRSVVFVSERSGAFNLWRMPAGGGNPTQLTTFADGMVRYPSIARRSGDIVFEYGPDLYHLPPGGNPRRIALQAATDDPFNLTERRTLTSGASDLAVSPDSKRLAFVLYGDIYSVSADGGTAKRLTSGPAVESDPAYSPDGKQIAFLSERNGTPQVCIMGTDGSNLRELSTGGGPKEDVGFSPDGKHVYFVEGPSGVALWRVAAEGGPAEKVRPGPSLDSWAVSPDGKWLLVSRSEIRETWDVELMPTDLSAPPVNITRRPGYNSYVRWIGDGRQIAYVYRDNWRRGLDPAIHVLPLERKPDKLDDEAADEADKDKERPLQVDWEDIHTRARQVASYAGQQHEFAVMPDGKTIVFVAAPDGTRRFYSVGVGGENLKPLATATTVSGSLIPDKAGKKVYYIGSGGSIQTVSLDGTSGRVAFTAEITVDRRDESKALFHQGYWILKHYFYDPGMHGVDWDAVRAEYEPFIERTYHNQDMTYFFTLMLGELGASHLGFSIPEDSPRPTGNLGVLLDETHTGPGARVVEVVKRTPASRPESLLSPGDTILQVDGKPVQHNESLHELLDGTVGKVVTLEVSNGTEKREVRIRPISGSALSEARYENMVDTRRAAVLEQSGGKLYYMHIQSMNLPSLERFERELWRDAAPYEGLILDVRGNGGGHIATFLLEALERRAYAYRQNRGEERLEVSPSRVWRKPTVLLIDEGSASNSEIFASGFRDFGLGKIVGTPTAAGVIGTSDRTLFDGRTTIRVPFVWVRRLDGTTMENTAVQPDILVPIGVKDILNRKDIQLERAVKECMEAVRRGQAPR
ncbi:MAG: tricorn protease [Fimbriimonadales bacterium]